MSSRIVMKLFDEDKISDEIVGSMLFNLKEAIGEKVFNISLTLFIEWKILLEKHLWITLRLLR